MRTLFYEKFDALPKDLRDWANDIPNIADFSIDIMARDPQTGLMHPFRIGYNDMIFLMDEQMMRQVRDHMEPMLAPHRLVDRGYRRAVR